MFVTRRLPEPTNGIPLKERLIRNENEVVRQCLRDQHSVEGIAVRLWEPSGSAAIVNGDLQLLEALTGDAAGHIKYDRIGSW